ncbi:MAG: hypothetical protein DYH02_16810 [Candidatus Omnitrophica bacterium COP1]|nr:hypothetical protein [Candidatus Omnitrophica bacterium COP1]
MTIPSPFIFVGRLLQPGFTDPGSDDKRWMRPPISSFPLYWESWKDHLDIRIIQTACRRAMRI